METDTDSQGTEIAQERITTGKTSILTGFNVISEMTRQRLVGCVIYFQSIIILIQSKSNNFGQRQDDLPETVGNISI